MIADHPVGVLDMDLRRACVRALSISRQACRDFALSYSWESSARQFIGNLSQLQTGRSKRSQGRLTNANAVRP